MKLLIITLFLSFWLDISDSPNSFVKDYETEITINNGKMTVTKSYIFQINNQNGNWLAEVSIPYSKGNRIKRLEGRILDLFGREIRRLKTKEVTTRSSISNISLYEDDFVKEFALKHNSYPYLIEYSYTQEFDEFLYIDRWYPSEYNIYTEHAKLTVNIPSDYEIKYLEKDLSVNDKTDQHRRVLTWEASEVNRIEEETLGPNWFELTPWVKIIPEKFIYGTRGQSDTWKNYGDWKLSLTEGSNDFSSEDIAKLKKIVGESNQKEEIVRRLYEYLQDNMRYINVSIDLGGLQPYPASYVAKNKYGDCKALTYYLRSSLSHFDIEAYPISIYWDDNPRPWHNTLPTHQSNHVFLAVPLEKDTLWVECTSKTYPYNYLDVNKAGTDILWMKNQGSEMIKIPKKEFEDVLCRRNVSYSLAGSLLNAEMSGTFRGEQFENLLSIQHHLSAKDQDSWIKRNFPFSSAEVSDWRILPRKRTDKHVRFKANFVQSNQTKKYGSNHVVFLPKSELPDLEEPGMRKNELRFRVPVHQIDTLHYQFKPDQCGEIKLPADQSIDHEFGSYRLTTKRNGTKITCIRELKLAAGIYNPDSDYKLFFDLIQQIKSIEKQSYITLKP